MWVEVINVEQCCSVDKPDENSTVIQQRPGKGAGTNRQASEKSSSLVEIIAPWEQTWGDKHWEVTSLGITQVLARCFGLRFAA